MTRRARAGDVDEIAASLPETELGISWGDRPTWKVRGKGFLIYRMPHRTAVDPDTGEMWDDLLVVTMPDMGAKQALVEADNPFFDIPHFHSHPGVLGRRSRLGEIDRVEREEIIIEAGAANAPTKLVRDHLGD